MKFQNLKVNKMSRKRFKPHKDADDRYIPMFGDIIEDIEVDLRVYSALHDDFIHPAFLNIKPKKIFLSCQEKECLERRSGFAPENRNV